MEACGIHTADEYKEEITQRKREENYGMQGQIIFQKIIIIQFIIIILKMRCMENQMYM